MKKFNFLKYQFSSLFEYQNLSQRNKLNEYKQGFLISKDFESYYNYMKILSRLKMYDEILQAKKSVPLFKQISFWREPKNKVIKDWIRQAQDEYYNQNPQDLPLPWFVKYPIIFFISYEVFSTIFDVDIEISLNIIPEEKEVKKTTGFKDVIGIDDYKEELQEVVDFLRNPSKYHESGAKLPKGILLVGRPGTGKTLLARALAEEAGCTFLYKSGAEFDEMFVGVGSSRVRQLFQEARQKQPCIIFIDEIDSIGGSRGGDDPKRYGTINQILTEMDGFRQNEAIIVIGATNMEQSLDAALTRAGRFDKTIHIMLPDIKGRKQLFEYYLKQIKHSDIDTQLLARQTTGLTGADIENIVNIAIMNAVKEKRSKAQANDFQHAIDRTRMGIRYKLTDQDKILTAYHESGHALINLLTEHTVPLDKVTILPRGSALGYTSMVPKEDTLSQTRGNILAAIDVCMGGRAAEDIKFGKDNISSGCGSDLANATAMAYAYVKDLGMGDTLISDAQTSKKFSYTVDMQVKQLLEESYNRVRNKLEQNQQVLQRFAEELLKHETMTADQLKSLL
ncbi:unnamed protein product [Paramecium octaurelia]|uniref:AAA+ ATPase domain-containing protein n=1 Tax=Paramecium octaurelia TaxID=43137 RepID=A0A8S1SN73_PAROT|nr:unnamed protein product [Paramecium octaurelia]